MLYFVLLTFTAKCGIVDNIRHAARLLGGDVPVLVRGYINFFEGECCFISDGPSSRFAQLHEGSQVRLSSGGPAVTLSVSGGKWTLNSPDAPTSLQGLSVWMELPMRG